MWIELGHFSVILAGCLCLLICVAGFAGAQRSNSRWMYLAANTTPVMALLLTLGFAALTYAFLQNDFSVDYVVRHSHSLMPTLYKISGVWGGHEGSLLLWVLMLSGWMFLIYLFSRSLPQDLLARILAVLALLCLGFLAFMLFTSNPFTRLAVPAQEGLSLNPMLQDPGLAFHPPMLYMGYVGMAVPFAFAIAALIQGRLDVAWTRWSRPWTLAAWMFLTLGIALGSYWAYYELGWGGWWFWDPVENASLLPWLSCTALLHSLVVTQKRGSFQNWTLLLAILGFALSLLGTFLVRSGVLTSVHAFATDPERGVFVLIFLALVVGASLLLFALKAHKMQGSGEFTAVSKDALLLANNVLLATACASVLLGTIYPLVVDTLGWGKLSVGPPYFNAIFVPLALILMALMGLGAPAHWKSDHLRRLLRAMRWPALAAGVCALAAALLAWPANWPTLSVIAFALSLWVMFCAVQQSAHQWRTAGWRKTPASYWGMQLAHLGVAVTALGITAVISFETESDIKMAPGQSVQAGNYRIEMINVQEANGPNYTAQLGKFAMYKEEKMVQTLYSEKRQYVSSSMPMTEAGIDSSMGRDIYVSLGEPLENGNIHGAWSVRVYYKPLVNWIWWGAILMALGAAIAVFDKRYRTRQSKRAASSPLTKHLEQSHHDNATTNLSPQTGAT